MKIEETLDRLIALYQSDSKHDREELNRILQTDAEARRHFAAFLLDEEILEEELKLQQVERLVDSDSLRPITQQARNEKSGQKLLYFVSGVVASAALIILGLQFSSMLSRKSGNELVDRVNSEKPSDVNQVWIAKLSQVSPSCKWEQAMDVGDEFIKQEYRLLDGEAIVSFACDVELIVQAPARFELLGPMEMILQEGLVRAKVGEAGHGFMIDTPETKIRDLGTEFGVSVGKDKATEIHVFNGEVELYKLGSSKPEFAFDGFAARWENGNMVAATTMEEHFPTSLRVAQQHRTLHVEEMQKDHSLLAWFDFRPNGNALSNFAGEKVADGIISNPTWVNGRWPGKNALLFDSDQQYVEFQLPEFSDSFSMQIWLKPERYIAPLGTVLNHIGWGAKLHHWQLTRDGSLRVGVGGDEGYAFTVDRPRVEVGKWSQLTLTYDAVRSQVSYYINDSKVRTVKYDYPSMQFGETVMGKWKHQGRSNRFFKGRVDEFSIWGRCLTADEIVHSYKVGKPPTN